MNGNKREIKISLAKSYYQKKLNQNEKNISSIKIAKYNNLLCMCNILAAGYHSGSLANIDYTVCIYNLYIYFVFGKL